MNTNQPAVYDPLTRALHWLTVAGFIGILTTIVLWTIYEEAEWAGSLFGLHKSFGFLTLTVIALPIVWAVANRAKRPQSDSKAAAAGHGILYLLILAVPVIGMIRQYGSGRGPLKVFDSVRTRSAGPSGTIYFSKTGPDRTKLFFPRP